MKQILQNIKNGQTEVVDVPCPILQPGRLLSQTTCSLVSAGTERMLIDFGKANYLAKARQQPDKVKQVLAKVKTDGLAQTVDAVRAKLDQPLALGYCNAGIVLESTVEGFAPGDRIASNGHHAEVVRVSKNLCAKIPDSVSDESAAFTVLAAIGLQGIRLIKPSLGETIVVSGLGLVGLLCVQMLRANGCRVLGIDFDTRRCELARLFGAEVVDLSKKQDPLAIAQHFSQGRGVDAVLIAAATKSDEVMHSAAAMCRKRGRIVLVGVVGLALQRDDFFKKEISFQVSASYGPGRYDPLYEEKGQDYPLGFVRWTEQRNFEAVLAMMVTGALDLQPLISYRYHIDEAVTAYQHLNDSTALGILLTYPAREKNELRAATVGLDTIHHAQAGTAGMPVIGMLGAGNYASRTLIPAFKAAGARLECLVSSTGISSVHHGKKGGFTTAATDSQVLWDHGSINTAVIVTRHNAHAEQVIAALKHGKHVFVEKPLALRLDELAAIEKAYTQANSSEKDTSGQLLMVGFNRRFAPHVVTMKALLSAKKEPKSCIFTVNAGAIPADHWTQDKAVGGGRIIGEACHFIDLMRFLVGYPIVSQQATMIGKVPGMAVQEDKVSITLSFADGSFGTIHYLANGSKAFPKERIEVFCADTVLQIDNYRVLRGFGWPGFSKMKAWKQDKGQNACVKAFVEAIQTGKPAPIPFTEIMESSRIAIAVADSLSS